MPDEMQEPTGDLSNLEGHDAVALDELAAGGIGEGDFDGDCPHVPPELTDLFIDLEGTGVTPGEFGDLVAAGLVP
jgi:hypothetical protein